MDVVHAGEMPWGESLVAQRGDGTAVAHKRLFEGTEDSPDHYLLVMAREPNSYFSPRHRHPWDQVRFCLEGSIPIAKGVFVDSGEIAYFPESTHYGPQEGGEDRVVLLLQFGGASGQGFIGPDRMKQARLEMAKHGRFEDGVYKQDVVEGRRNRDAYEAIWLHVKGDVPTYAAPVYKTPVVMLPAALPWKVSHEANVSTREIGVFPHRGLSITSYRLAPGGSHVFPADTALRLLFVTAGTGHIEKHALRHWSSVRVNPGELATLHTDSGLEWMQLTVLPVAPEQA